MGRPSKLSPAQWREVDRRAAEGESIKALAEEFGVARSTISDRVSVISDTVRKVAMKVADGHAALATLPVRLQHVAVNLADKLRNISDSLAAASELGAATAHRLHALANNEVSKIDDAEPLASIDVLKGVAALTKMANESAVVPLALLAANRNTPTAPTEAEVRVIELVALLPR